MLIREFFAGKNIFMTGGSGFIGKVLIEKLLRSCPDVGNIYVLIRGRKGKTAQERLKVILDNPLFDKVKELYPDAVEKIIPVAGDVSEMRLGISDVDRQTLIERVNIIYNTAASVRFDDNLKYAIIVNVRSTREVIELASELKNLSILIHVSTTYCNTDMKILEEKIYPPHGNWRDAIRAAEEVDPAVLDAFTQKYIEPMPNTYTYAKSLAEQVVNDLCQGKLPATIVRPSVVISTLNEPIRGWNDNLNGPVGLLAAGGKGLLRICWGHGEAIQDYVPVDSLAKFLVMVAREKCLTENLTDVDVYNASKYNIHPLTTDGMIKLGERIIWDVPFSEILWYPRFSTTSCYYNYYIQVLLFHMLPAFFLDIILRIAGRKPILFTVQRKIYIANVVLEYFIRYSWAFVNTKSMKINEKLSQEDKKDFGFDDSFNMDMEDVYEYFRDSAVGSMTHIFKEPFNKEQNVKKTWRLWALDLFIRFIAGGILLWFLLIKYNILNVGLNYCQNYIQKL